MRIPPVARFLAGHAVRWHGVVCLNYHRIGDGSRSLFDRQVYSATAEGFSQQVRWLQQHFEIVSPRDLQLIKRLKRGRHVLLSFDDGYRDNYTDAFRVLKEERATATFFIATGFLDDPHLSWWDEIAWMMRTSKRSSVKVESFDIDVTMDEPDRERAITVILRAYRALPSSRTEALLDAVAAATGSGRATKDQARDVWMTWDMVREMKAGGMTIGGHTVRHQILSRLEKDEQAREIAACKARLAKELDQPMRAFAYPVGGRDTFDDVTRAALKDNGVRVAFSYYGGVPKLDAWDEYDVPRVPIEAHHSFEDFKAILMFPWRTY